MLLRQHSRPPSLLTAFSYLVPGGGGATPSWGGGATPFLGPRQSPGLSCPLCSATVGRMPRNVQ